MKNAIQWVLLLICANSLSGCVGSDGSTTTSPTIGAVVTNGTGTYTCAFLTSGRECNILLTYNTNNNKGLTLNYAPNPTSSCIAYSGSLFNSTLSGCQTNINNSESGTCTIIIQYGSSSCNTNVNLAFTLGSATSSPTINVTGS